MKQSRLLLVTLAMSSAASTSAVETYIVDKSHSEVSFRVRHLVTKVSGRFLEFEGTIKADPENTERSNVHFIIQAKSIDTGNAKRDEHLRSADFFNVESHPTVTFKSRSVRPIEPDRFEVLGDLTMHGITKELTLPVTYLGMARDPWGAVRAGFEVSTRLNRKDFGIVWNQTLDAGGLLLGDEVEITINLEAIKKELKSAQ